MSTFTPTQWTLQPADQPDQLSSAVIHTLSRPVSRIPAWGPVETFVLGILSFGILPLLFWPRRFADFVVGEQRQWWHLVEWLRIRTGDPQAEKLRNSIRTGGAPITLRLIPLIMLVLLALDFGPWLAKPWARHRREILVTTYRYDHSGLRTLDSNWASYPTVPAQLYEAWVICLGFAYFSQWLHVRQHAADIQSILRQTNDILVRHQMAPVPMFHNSLGLRPLWLCVAAAGGAVGAWWMVPAAFAGAVQWRYTMRTSIQVRTELAHRVHGQLLAQRPPLDIPTPHRLRQICAVPLCGKAIPDGATFCPRCGTRFTPPSGQA